MNQDLTFEAAKKQFAKKNLPLGEVQMKTLGIMTHDEVYTNLGLLLSDQCVHTIKVAALKELLRASLKTGENFPALCFSRWMKYMIILIFVIRSILHSRNCTGLTREIIRKQQSGRHF